MMDRYWMEAPATPPSPGANFIEIDWENERLRPDHSRERAGASPNGRADSPADCLYARAILREPEFEWMDDLAIEGTIRDALDAFGSRPSFEAALADIYEDRTLFVAIAARAREIYARDPSLGAMALIDAIQIGRAHV